MHAGLTDAFGHGITRHFLETYVDEMYVHDAQGQFVDVNLTACNNLGYTREEMLGMRVEQISELDRTVLEQIWARQIPGSNTMSANQHRRKDGSYYQLDVHITCLEIHGEKYFMGLGRRAEERHSIEAQILQLNAQLENLLHERTLQWEASSRMLETFMEQTPDGVFIKDNEGRYQYVNPALLQRSDLRRSDVLGHTDTELFAPDLAQQYLQTDQKALATNRPIVYEEQLLIDNKTQFFNVMKTPYRDANGQVAGVLGMTRDITETRHTQDQLAHNYEMLCQAELIAKVGSWTLNLDTNTFTNSEMLAIMNGQGPEDPPLTPQSLSSMIPPEQHQLLSQAIQECLLHGTPYTIDVQHKRPGGGYFPGRIRGQAFRNAQGRITMLHGTLQDLTDSVEAEERLQSLADNLPNGAIFRCEQTGAERLCLRYVSAGIIGLLGMSPQGLMSDQSRFAELFLQDDRIAFFDAMLQSLTSKTPFIHVCRMVHTNGSWRWMRIRAMARQTHEAVYWEGILLDITAEHIAQQELQNAKEAAEAAERAKSEFLATMSHEIRTPMNTVIGMTQLLQQTPMSPKQRNYLDKVGLSANTLLKIINDILDFSKLEAEMLQIAPVSFQLDELLESVTSVTGLRAEQKGIEIVYNIAPSVPRRLLGDLQRLSQVLTNLVSNAIKFTDRGEIVISMHAQSNPSLHAENYSLHVSVRDTGIGIQAAHMPLLFQPFAQAEAHTSRRFGGTGLGLAICHKLVTLMGGSISVRSQPGQGSEFNFDVQLKAQASDTLPKSFSTPHCRVLVVDDNLMAREILSQMVQGFGLECATASSGPEALTMLETASQQNMPFELVLMDWQMPGMDGLQVAERIRQHQHLSSTPAMLMVTAYCRDEVLERVAQLQLQGLLIKPVTESVLFNAIQDSLQLHSSHHVLPSKGLGKATAFTPPASLRHRRILVVDDNALNREVAQDFLELAGVQVTTASSGREALALLEQRDLDAVLLDVQMPEMDGLEVARRIRSNSQWAQLPIWALTAQARQAILASGMHGQLTKPIDAQVLYDTLDQALAHLPPALPASTSVQAAQSANSAGIARHFAGHQDRIQRLLRAFIRDFAHAPAHILELHAAQDWKALHLLAHTLKGSLGYLDQPAAMHAMEDLEWACLQEHASSALAESATTQLQAVLAHVAQRLTPPSTSSVAQSTAPDTALLQATVQQAIPLIRRGDYAGMQLLEQVESHLRGSPLHGLAARALALAEDLEPDAACTCLHTLIEAFNAPSADPTPL